MKWLLLLFVFSAFACNNEVHSIDCSNIRNGKFIMFTKENPSGLLITRNGDRQIEETKDGFKFQFDVKWTSDCTYELSGAKLLSGSVPSFIPDSSVVFVKVTKVTPKSYTAEVTSSTDNEKTEFEIEILKK